MVTVGKGVLVAVGGNHTVVGVLVAMRDLFGGGVAPGALALAWAAAALYAAGAILLAAYVFSREWALMRGV